MKIIRESLNENIIVPPDVPNTMNFWHGGNLDEYNDIIAQKNGRYEYGAGLYLITRYDIAKRYAKGSRKLYLITVTKGNDIADSYLDMNKVKEFMHSYIIKDKQRIILSRLDRYIEDNKVPADIFNNMILNEKAIKSTKTKYLRDFFVSNHIDYEIVNNAFGFGEEMMVLYNMKKIFKIIQVKSTDDIQVFNLKN